MGSFPRWIQGSFRHVLINMCMQKHNSFTKPRRRFSDLNAAHLICIMQNRWVIRIDGNGLGLI